MIVVVAAGRWRRRGLVVEGGGERLVLGDGMGTLAPLTLAHARLNCAVARAVMVPVEMVTDQAACYLRVFEQMLPEALRQQSDRSRPRAVEKTAATDVRFEIRHERQDCHRWARLHSECTPWPLRTRR